MSRVFTANRKQRSLVFGAAAASVLFLRLAAPLPGQVTLLWAPEQPPSPPRGPDTVTIEVDPAPEPRPALKHRFVTRYGEQIPGNAVPFYYRALAVLQDMQGEPMKEYNENYERWLAGPPDEATHREIREFLDRFRNVFGQLELASRRDRVEWEWGERHFQGTEWIEFLLPEIQQMRTFARLLQLKARLEIAEGRFDDAIETFRVGYALGRSVGEAPFLISKLVGVAICAIMNAEVRQFPGAPGAPNLYWALTELPHPLVDMRSALRFEMTMPERMFPFLRDAETIERSPEEWRSLLRDAVAQMAQVEGLMADSDRLRSARAELMLTGLAMQGYPRAKRDLIADGFDAERIERMPVAQVVAIHQARVYRRFHDEIYKWALLPYSEALPHRREADEKLRAEGYYGSAGQTREIVPIAALLFPAVFQAMEAELRNESRVAVLRALEAVRMQAAANGGRLPASLDAVTVVPVPVNPRDGQPFPYQLDGETAILELPPPTPDQVLVGWRFVITLRKD